MICGFLACMGLGRFAIADDNPVILQWFENKWEHIERKVPDFFMAGYGAVWLPPPSKAAGSTSVGYDVFNRFDLGRPLSETAYGTENDFHAVIDELHAANGQVYIDTIMNHNNMRNTSASFQAAGGYPGFWMASGNPPVNKQPTDPWGDFHAGVASGYLQSENPGGARYDLIKGDLVALIDIAQESNNQFIRHPVQTGDPQNIPAGTIYNKPDPSNARFYPDLGLPGFTFWNPGAHGFGSQQFTIYPFNTADPMQGDAVTDNTTGLLMRWSQWMCDEFGIDGFRLDAAKHAPNWFWDMFWDSAVYLRRTTPDNRQVTPFSFVESVDSNSFTANNYTRKNDGFGNRDALDINGAGKLRDLVNANGLGTWNNVFDNNSGHIDGFDDGFQNGSLGVNHVFSHDNGSVGNGGSLPPLPSDKQMGFFTYAYMLMRPGRAIVYHNARGIVNRSGGFYPREGVSVALGLNPSSGLLDSRLTKLVQIHTWVGRGQYFPLNSTDPQNQSMNDVLIFERASPIGGGARVGNVLVGVNDRYDAGTQTRNVLTSFSPGTRLHELTGNSANPTVDPSGTIPELLVVNGSGRVTITVPNNRSSAGEHNLGYVIYAPALPTGSLQLSNVSGTIPADPPQAPAYFRRLNDVDVISADTFSIQLITTQTDTQDPNTDDDALFLIDQGYVDYNNNGQDDFNATNLVFGGYERFATTYLPLFGSANNIGQYVQAIDATLLSEGYHYLTVAGLRHRTAGSPLFREWRKVIYVDRLPPAVLLDNPTEVVTSTSHEFTMRALDRTTKRIHLLLDLPAGQDPIAAADVFNAAAPRDRFEWRMILAGLTHGWHKLTLVAFEVNDTSSVTEYDVFVDICQADVNNDGSVDVLDFFAFIVFFNSGSLEVDFNQDGNIDVLDFFQFIVEFNAGC